MAKPAAATPWDSTMDTFVLQLKLIFQTKCLSNPGTQFPLLRIQVSSASTFLNGKMYFMYCRLSRKIKNCFTQNHCSQQKFFQTKYGLEQKEAAEKASQNLANIRFGKQLEKVAKIFVMTFGWCSNCLGFYGLKAQQKNGKSFHKVWLQVGEHLNRKTS